MLSFIPLIKSFFASTNTFFDPGFFAAEGFFLGVFVIAVVLVVHAQQPQVVAGVQYDVVAGFKPAAEGGEVALRLQLQAAAGVQGGHVVANGVLAVLAAPLVVCAVVFCGHCSEAQCR